MRTLEDRSLTVQTMSQSVTITPYVTWTDLSRNDP